MAIAGHGKGSFIFVWGNCCGLLAMASQEVATRCIDWAPGRDKVERRGTRAFLLPSCPTSFSPMWAPQPLIVRLSPAPAVAHGASTQLASGIKAPEERGHSHHEQGIEVDHTSPARVLTDVLQPTGCCIHLLLGRGWGTTCPTPAHSTEPEQALVEQAWCLGLGLWEN